MLSVGVVASASTAGHYFAQDNYYTKEGAEKTSEWWGKTAEQLGLTGHVKSELFVSVLGGQLPNGQQLGIMRDGKLQHRPGYDLTFSAPKSLSLLVELGGDTRLVQAHQQAVKATLSHIEEIASARKTSNYR